MTWFIAGKSPIQVSNLHRAVWVDETTGKVVCGPQPNARQQVVEQWGSDMRRLFRQAGLPRASAPADGCEKKAMHRKARHSSPRPCVACVTHCA